MDLTRYDAAVALDLAEAKGGLPGVWPEEPCVEVKRGLMLRGLGWADESDQLEWEPCLTLWAAEFSWQERRGEGRGMGCGDWNGGGDGRGADSGDVMGSGLDYGGGMGRGAGRADGGGYGCWDPLISEGGSTRSGSGKKKRRAAVPGA